METTTIPEAGRKKEGKQWEQLVKDQQRGLEEKTKSITLSIEKQTKLITGFVSDLNEPVWHNKLSYLANMPIWYYFSCPINLAYHNLRSIKTSTTTLSTNIKSLLGLGLKFCPTPRYTSSTTDVASTLTRHLRDLRLKHYFRNDLELTDYNPRS
jgi:hypothetical protein